jgi:hypothetical protein
VSGSHGLASKARAILVLPKVYANGSLDTLSVKSEVSAFVLTNAGLMLAATVDASKISRIQF